MTETTSRNFMELIQARWDEGKFVCVGLDSDTGKLPDHLQDRGRCSEGDAQLKFNKAIVEATCNIVCAYKPNLAYYAPGNGDYALRSTVRYIRELAPRVPVILDAKWGDIGNTNNSYLKKLDWYEADAVTVHPYLGMEAMKPFLDQKDKGVIVLVRTSNPGAGEFQDLRITETGDPDKLYDYEDHVVPLYQIVARHVARGWNYNGNCAVVVGATYPDELAKVRKIVRDMPILIPGIGAQGGELEATVKAGANSNGQGMIINSSRGIIFASSGEDFAEAARRETQKLHDDITAVLAAV